MEVITMRQICVAVLFCVLPAFVFADSEAIARQQEILNQVRLHFEKAKSPNQTHYPVTFKGVVALPVRVDLTQAKIKDNNDGSVTVSNVAIVRPYRIFNRKAYVKNETIQGAGVAAAIGGGTAMLASIVLRLTRRTVSQKVFSFGGLALMAVGAIIGGVLGRLRAHKSPAEFERSETSSVTLVKLR